MNQVHRQRARLLISWNVDEKIAVRCRDLKTRSKLLTRFWNKNDVLFHCHRDHADEKVFILPAKARDFLKNEDVQFEIVEWRGKK